MSDPAGSVDPDAYRRAVGRFATGVTVVTTRSGGVDLAMTANAFTSVSLDPLLVLVCIAEDARFHDAVEAAGTWAVSVLAHGQQPLAARFAAQGRPLHGQLDRVPVERGPATGAALLPGALATLECATRERHPGGDHTIVVGEVLAIAAPPREDPALVWYRGSYHRLG